MEVVLVLVSIAFLVTLGVLMYGKKNVAQAPVLKADDSRARQLEGELEKKRRELEEQRKSLQETKDELKQVKKKLYEQRESDKENRDLVKARAEVERNATAQLEATRGELAAALAELDRLKNEGPRRGGPVRAAAPVETAPVAAPAALPVATQAAPALAEPPRRVIRELSEADKERMDRLERDARKAREKASELERELRRIKSKLDTQSRVYVVTKGELELVKDKYKALEKRTNRTLLANDLLKRAIRDLEKKTGIAADRTELTEDEVSASDRQVEDRVNAEVAKDEERHAMQVRAVEEAAARAEKEAQSTEVAASAAPPAEPTAPAAPEGQGTEAPPQQH